jgi:hypothetical protein
MDNNGSTKAGTIGGTLLVTLLNIFSNDAIRTIGFAALGATVSFFISLFWNNLLQRFRNRRSNSVTRRGSEGGDPHQQ